MKKGKIVLLVILALILIGVGALFLRLYPAWKSAEVLAEKMDLAHFTYEVEIELDKEALPSEYTEIFASLSELSGMDESVMYHLTAKGSVWEDMIYAEIFHQGAEEALIELYLSDDEDVVNESRLYDAFRDNIVGRSGLLEMMIPKGEKNVYMTLEQADKLFGIDLSAVSNFTVPFTDMSFTQKEYFAVLAALSREKQENQDDYALEMDRIQLSLSVPKADSNAKVVAALSVQEPAEALAEAADLVAKLGIEIPVENFAVFKSFSIIAEPGEGNELVMPTNYISQETINVLSEVAALIEQFMKK